MNARRRTLHLARRALTAAALFVAAAALRPAHAQVSPDILGTNTAAILATTVAGFPSCIAWRPTGVCFWLHCTIFGCSVKTSIKVSHYAPDAIVSSYSDPANHPWTDFGKPVASMFSGVGASLVGSMLDASAATARDDHEMALFKSTDAVGNPLANLIALASGAGEAAMPDSIPVPDTQELMKFPAQELPRIAALWATVPAQVGNTMAQDARNLVSNPGSLLSGITSIPGGFASAMGGMQGGIPSQGLGGSNSGGGIGNDGGAQGPSSGFNAGELMNIVSAVTGGDGGGLLCPGGTQAYNIYYHSDLDSWFWRSMITLDLLYPQAWIPGLGEVGNFGINTWGNVYPRSGELVQAHPAKASAVLSSRVHSIISQPAQAHIYKKMQTPGGYKYFARYADPKWQPVFPVPEPGCITFGTPDLIGPFAARDFKTSSTDGYIWNMWTRYECCRIRGAFLFSIP